MKNALSIDLEDWFCSSTFDPYIRREEWPRLESRVDECTALLLDLFKRRNARATFFVLGWVAERSPDLIRRVVDDGHEIACHGYHHHRITQQEPDEFEDDICRAVEVLGRCVDDEIIGYRAPSFSITKETLWALPILRRHGFIYDSSVFPMGYHPSYGIDDAPLDRYEIIEGLVELPMSCASFGSRRLPCGGGNYFRLFPYRLSRALMRRCNRQGRPAVFYAHPWEFDPSPPVFALPWIQKFRHHNGIRKTLHRLERLMGDFEFTTVRDLLNL